MEVDDCILTVPIGEGTRLRLLPAGKALEDPAAFFRTPGFRKATAKFKNAGEILLVDSPPLLAVADTSAIAAQADGIVLVVDRGTQLSLLADVRERLAFVGTPLLGYVFNRARPAGGVPTGTATGTAATAPPTASSRRPPRTAGSASSCDGGAAEVR